MKFQFTFEYILNVLLSHVICCLTKVKYVSTNTRTGYNVILINYSPVFNDEPLTLLVVLCLSSVLLVHGRFLLLSLNFRFALGPSTTCTHVMLATCLFS